MKRSGTILAAVLLTTCAALPACNSGDAIPPTLSTPVLTSHPDASLYKNINTVRMSRNLHKSINNLRIKQKLPTLRWDRALSRIAARHSKDMALRNFFSHIDPEGRGPVQRYFVGNYACGITVDGVLHTGGENISRVPYSPTGDDAMADADEKLFSGRLIDTILQDWWGNAADRSNILAPHWQREGIGISIRPDGTLLVTINFC